MAKATYIASVSVGATGGFGGLFLGLGNKAGSGKIVRVQRADVLSIQSGSTVNAYNRMYLHEVSGLTGTTAASVVSLDTNSPDPVASNYIVALESPASWDTGPKVYATLDWPNRTPVVSDTWKDFVVRRLPAASLLFESDSVAGVDPITLREGEGVGVCSFGAAFWGTIQLTFTVE